MIYVQSRKTLFFPFLDLILTADVISLCIVTSIYRISVAGNTILMAPSSHPKHTIQSISVREIVLLLNFFDRNIMDIQNGLYIEISLL